MRMLCQKILGCIARAGLPHKKNGMTIRRPHRLLIEVGRRCEVKKRLSRRSVDADKAVIVASRHKGKMCAVRRPDWAVILSTIEKEALGFACCVVFSTEGRRPDLTVFHKGQVSRRGTGRAISLRYLDRGGVGVFGGNRPDCNFGLRGTTVRIRGKIALGRPILVVISTAHVDEFCSVGRKSEPAEFLSIILGVMGKLAGCGVCCRS